jgi:GNAT superfamily N-acetyltransferase
MEATGYNWVPDGAHACAGLVRRIYGEHPAYAAALAAETLRQLAPQNPFIAYGARQGFLAAAGGRTEAHACAITDSRLPGAGFIGYFEAAGEEAAAAVLSAACEYLAARGVKQIFGPVNDTVWQRYGACSSGDAPAYAGEPYTPAAYADYFKAAGFEAADRRLTTSLPAAELPFAAYAGRESELQKKGFTFEELAPAALPARAREIHALAAEVFCDSPLFVPASYEEFLYSAGPGSAGDSLFLLAGAGGRPAAFLWGLPDACSGGGNFIFRTIAVLPAHRRAGLGGALFCRMQARVLERGFKRCLFSTMRAGNTGIETLAPRGAVPYREYLTFRKALC